MMMTIGNSKKASMFSLALLVFASTAVLRAQSDEKPLVVTATNAAAANQLLVYSAEGNLLKTLSTQGKGGAAGNSGGIESKDGVVAVVNFGSNSVAMFERDKDILEFKQLVPTASAPLSVALSADHLYILGATTVESHRMYGAAVNAGADGVVTLLKADGSAAQVGVLPKQLIITEKDNVIETVDLLAGGAVSGVPTLVMNIPSNVNAPFGLVTRGNDAYVTIAHADEISLVRNGDVLTVTSSGTQHAPCWLALTGPFLYSANSPSHTLSRYAVYGQKIVQDAAIAASMGGAPTDITTGDGLLAVIDGSGTLTHLSIFTMDEDGNLTLRIANTINAQTNGVAIVRN